MRIKYVDTACKMFRAQELKNELIIYYQKILIYWTEQFEY